MSRRCLVAICHNGPVVFTKTARSLMELGFGDRVEQAKTAHGFEEVAFGWFGSSPRVDSLRDMAAESAMDAKFTHLLFLDADMIWPSDLMKRMLAHHDKGIVSGLYIQKYRPFYPIALRGPVKNEDGCDIFTHDQDFERTDTELRPEAVVGMGCTIIDLKIFTAIGDRPWFSYKNNDHGWPVVSEDVPFCRKATEAGFGVWLDPSVKCGHVVVDTVTETNFRRYQASQRKMDVTVTQAPGSAA